MLSARGVEPGVILGAVLNPGLLAPNTVVD